MKRQPALTSAQRVARHRAKVKLNAQIEKSLGVNVSPETPDPFDAMYERIHGAPADALTSPWWGEHPNIFRWEPGVEMAWVRSGDPLPETQEAGAEWRRKYLASL